MILYYFNCSHPSIRQDADGVWWCNDCKQRIG